MENRNIFSGTYQPNCVEFLLKPVSITLTSIEEKERLIQSGKKHYSEILSQEPEPSDKHLKLFNQAFELGAERLALETVQLAKSLIQRLEGRPIVLVSLVRAGVPLGVMLHQTIRELGFESYHYGVSIIRDKGIDHEALNIIEDRHGTEGIVFVDGWTGKGAISKELSKNLHGRTGYPKEPRLVVLADPCGTSWLSASSEDWLIPFGILGSPISGLVSRSIWTESGLHGCVHCNHLSHFDISQKFIDDIEAIRKKLDLFNIKPSNWCPSEAIELNKQSLNVINKLTTNYQIDNINRIKAGIAEATRAVLRRVPDHVLVKNIQDQDVSLLVHLASEAGVNIIEVGDLIGAYRAVTIIKKVS